MMRVMFQHLKFIRVRRDDARSASKIYTASGATIDKTNFNPEELQTETLFLAY